MHLEMKKKIDIYFAFFNNSKSLIIFDIARLTALFLILLMHVESGFNSYTGNQFNNFVAVGSYGVPIFFFISGFLIFKSIIILPMRRFSSFWYRRIIRIVPLCYSMLVIYILCIISFSKFLNNFQEIHFSKILSSLFFDLENGFNIFSCILELMVWICFLFFCFYF